MGRLLARNFSGPSIKFDGSVTKIVSTNAIDFTSSGNNGKATFMAWVKNINYNISKRFIGAMSGNYTCGISSGNQYFIGVHGVSTAIFTTLITKEWVHVAFVVDGLTAYFYYNGALAGSGVIAIPTASNPYQIGSDSVNWTDGYIAEPAIFNRVLTAEEIRVIYEQGPDAYPKDGSCVLDYRFKEGAVGGISNEIIDYSGKGNHGQLTMGSGRIDPYNIPVPNRVLIPGNMSLVGIESTGTNGLNITDANLAAAFGVATGEVGINGISAGAWVKKKRHVTNYQTVASKGAYGASGFGGVVNLQTSINALSPISYGASSVIVSNENKNYNNYSHATWVNGISYGKCFHAGIKTRHETKTLTGNGSNNFSLISAGAGNITTVSMPFLANRILTDSEVYNIYSKSTFPPDVLFWHGPDETGTKIACYRGTYSPASRIPSCDGTLPAGITFTDDVPWR